MEMVEKLFWIKNQDFKFYWFISDRIEFYLAEVIK